MEQESETLLKEALQRHKDDSLSAAFWPMPLSSLLPKHAAVRRSLVRGTTHLRGKKEGKAKAEALN